eukprot:767636-Hanusia_phi.AAC.5
MKFFFSPLPPPHRPPAPPLLHPLLPLCLPTLLPHHHCYDHPCYRSQHAHNNHHLKATTCDWPNSSKIRSMPPPRARPDTHSSGVTVLMYLTAANSSIPPPPPARPLILLMYK